MTHGLHGALQLYTDVAMEVLEVAGTSDFRPEVRESGDAMSTLSTGTPATDPVTRLLCSQNAVTIASWHSLDELTLHIVEALDYMITLRDGGVSRHAREYLDLMTLLTVRQTLLSAA
jgi:hypothetical protein